MSLNAFRQSCGSTHITWSTGGNELIHRVRIWIHRTICLSSVEGELVELWTKYVVPQQNMYSSLPHEAAFATVFPNVSFWSVQVPESRSWHMSGNGLPIHILWWHLWSLIVPYGFLYCQTLERICWDCRWVSSMHCSIAVNMNWWKIRTRIFFTAFSVIRIQNSVEFTKMVATWPELNLTFSEANKHSFTTAIFGESGACG